MAVAAVGLVAITILLMRPQNLVLPLLGGLQHSPVSCGFGFVSKVSVPGQRWGGGSVCWAGLKKMNVLYFM